MRRYKARSLSKFIVGASILALALPGVAFVDLDESSNRVLVAVEDVTARETARRSPFRSRGRSSRRASTPRRSTRRPCRSVSHS